MKYVRILMVLAMLATSLLAVVPVLAEEPASTYTVVAGDTLFEIARDQLGVGDRYLEIVELTNKLNAADDTYAFIENPDLIEIGWVLGSARGQRDHSGCSKSDRRHDPGRSRSPR